MVVIFEAIAARIAGAVTRIGDAWGAWPPRLPAPWPSAARLGVLELALTRLPIAGSSLLGLLLLLWLALA